MKGIDPDIIQGEKLMEHHPKKTKNSVEEEDDLLEEDEIEQHVFLSKQPSCIKGSTLKPYQLVSHYCLIRLK